MKLFKEKIRNRLLLNNSEIAAELTPSSKGLRRWVVIFPNDVKSVNETVPDHRFSILDFELREELVDEFFSEDDKINQKRVYVESEEKLYSALGLMGVSPEVFDVPWNCDCPL